MKKLIETYSYHLEVDTEAEIRKNTKTLKEGLNGDWYWCSIYNTIGRTGDITPYDFKITAHRPKDYAPILEGVPLMEASKKIVVGSKVKVMDDLVTTITRIEGDKYYFNDADGNEWQESPDVMEIIESPSEDDEVERVIEWLIPVNIHQLEIGHFYLVQFIDDDFCRFLFWKEDYYQIKKAWKPTNVRQQSEKKYSEKDMRTAFEDGKKMFGIPFEVYLRSLNKTKWL